MRRYIKRIGGFQPVSLIDWDEKISSVIFLTGCNWRCNYCHNKKLSKPKNIVNEDKIIEKIKNKKNWINNIVICGGEPLYRTDIIEFLRRLREYKIKIKLDTNGAYPHTLKALIEDLLVDYIALDIKTRLSDDKYFNVIGLKGQIASVLQSIEILQSSDIEHEFRTTFIPDLVDVGDVVYNLKYISKGSKYIIQQYSNENVTDEYLKNKQPCNSFILNNLVEIIKRKGYESWLRT